MKKTDMKNNKLQFEELETAQEFSFGSLGVSAISVTAVLIIICGFLF